MPQNLSVNRASGASGDSFVLIICPEGGRSSPDASDQFRYTVTHWKLHFGMVCSFLLYGKTLSKVTAHSGPAFELTLTKNHTREQCWVTASSLKCVNGRILAFWLTPFEAACHSLFPTFLTYHYIPPSQTPTATLLL